MTIYLNLSTLYYNTVVAWKQRLANCILTGLIGNAIYVKKELGLFNIHDNENVEMRIMKIFQ